MAGVNASAIVFFHFILSNGGRGTKQVQEGVILPFVTVKNNNKIIFLSCRSELLIRCATG
jgi:hypothetical protein